MQNNRGVFDFAEATGDENQQVQNVEKIREHTKQPKREAEKKESGKATKPTAALLKKRFIECDQRCQLSGVKLSHELISLDHEIPLEAGGKHVLENLLIVHPRINTMKGSMSRAEFVNWCKLVSSSHQDDSGEENW